MAKRNEMEIPDRVNLVAEDAVLEGTLYIDGDVRINGRIIGSVKVQERVVMGSEGLVEGDLTAAEADLAGVVQGGVEVAERLVLRSAARIAGTIKAGDLVIEDGAVFNGTCQMGRSLWAPQQEAGTPQDAVVSRTLDKGPHTDAPPLVTDPDKSEEIRVAEDLAVPEALPIPVVSFDESAERPAPLPEATDPEAPVDSPEAAEAQTPDEPEPTVAKTPTVAPKPPRSAVRIPSRLHEKRTPGSLSGASRPSALRGMIKKNAPRLATPGGAGGMLAVAAGALLVLYLIAGGFSSIFSRPGTAADPVAQPAEQATAPDAPMAETNTPSDPDAAPAMTDAGREVVDPAEAAAAETEAARQTAEQQRATMEQARRQVAARLDEQEVQALAQQAEAARRTGTRAFADEDFEQAIRSFRSANQRFLQIKTTLDAKDQALADAAEPSASDAAESTSPDIESTAEAPEEQTEPTQPTQPAASEPASEPPPAQPAVQRLAGYLKSNIEQENAGGMQALFHRGWEPFFEQADGIRATVRPGTAEVKGTQATVRVQVDLQYRDAEQESQQDTRSYAWTLHYLDGDWVLMQVAAQ